MKVHCSWTIQLDKSKVFVQTLHTMLNKSKRGMKSKNYLLRKQNANHSMRNSNLSYWALFWVSAAIILSHWLISWLCSNWLWTYWRAFRITGFMHSATHNWNTKQALSASDQDIVDTNLERISKKKGPKGIKSIRCTETLKYWCFRHIFQKEMMLTKSGEVCDKIQKACKFHLSNNVLPIVTVFHKESGQLREAAPSLKKR